MEKTGKQEINYYKFLGVYPSNDAERIKKHAKLKIIDIKVAYARKDYEKLGVSKKMDDRQLKKIAEARIAEIAHASMILLNPKTRKKFDIQTYGKSYFNNNYNAPLKIGKVSKFIKKWYDKAENENKAILSTIAILGLIIFIIHLHISSQKPDSEPLIVFSQEKISPEISSVLHEEKVNKLNERAYRYLVGQKVPYHLFREIGQPQTLKGTNNSVWRVYFPKGDFTLVSNKNTDIVIEILPGKRGETWVK
jgi:phage pi2 protein 07